MIHSFDQQDHVSGTRFRNQYLGSMFTTDFHAFTDGFIGDGFGVSRQLFLSILYFGLLGVLWQEIPNMPLFAIEWLVGLAPIWLPLVLLVGAWKIWIWYVRAIYLGKTKTMLLEVKMSRDTVRSPRAMENALAVMWIDSGTTTFFNTAWQGQVLPFTSFEIASFGGEVHFYIWCWRSWKDTIESVMYSYYPEVELVEVEDYASKFNYDPDKYECFPTDWRYEPRNDAYPIKTYVEFELDKDPKEEYKVDPLAPVLERMTNLKPHEQMWVQIIITLNKDVRRKKGGWWWETESRWNALLEGEIEALRKKTVGNPDDPHDKWKSYARVQLYRYTEVIRAIDRNLGKHPFNVGMRGVYISTPDDFSTSGYTGLRWIWRPMGNPQYMNQMRPRRWGNPMDFPWQDLWDMRWQLLNRRFFDAYRRRSYFYAPWITPYNMMSSEVIATLWHPPSGGISAPGLERIPATKAEPPPNLPK